MRYLFDIDGTICSQDDWHNYDQATPFQPVVDKINELYHFGNLIVLYTAREEKWSGAQNITVLIDFN